MVLRYIMCTASITDMLAMLIVCDNANDIYLVANGTLGVFVVVDDGGYCQKN